MHAHLLDLIVSIMSGELYGLLNSSCIFPQRHVISWTVRCRYSSQHPVLPHPQSMSLPYDLNPTYVIKGLGSSVLYYWFHLSVSVDVFLLGGSVILATAEWVQKCGNCREESKVWTRSVQSDPMHSLLAFNMHVSFIPSIIQVTDFYISVLLNLLYSSDSQPFVSCIPLVISSNKG
jgi:hypothetical protein